MLHRLMAMLILAAVAAMDTGPAAAQSTDEALRALRRDVEGLREGQQKIQKDLQEIRDLLRTRGAAAAPEPPKDLAFALAGRIVKGAPGARVVLVDFTDYQ